MVYRILRTQLLSYTAGLLKLTPEQDYYPAEPNNNSPINKNLVIKIKVGFIYQTASKFLFYNNKTKVFLARKVFIKA